MNQGPMKMTMVEGEGEGCLTSGDALKGSESPPEAVMGKQPSRQLAGL